MPESTRGTHPNSLALVAVLVLFTLAAPATAGPDDPRLAHDGWMAPPSPTHLLLAPAAGPSGNLMSGFWRSTFTQPAAGWEQPGFNDAAWVVRPAGFGGDGTLDPLDNIRTNWPAGTRLWARTTITLTAEQAQSPLCLYGRYDDLLHLYINGVLAFEQGWSSSCQRYEFLPIRAAARAVMHEGTNTIAALVEDTGGARYFDMGLARNPMSDLPSTGWEASPALHAFDDFARDFARDNLIPALTIGVMRQDRVVALRGYGWLDKQRTRPTPPDTLFRIASLDKAVSAAVVRRLIVLGTVDPVTGTTLTESTPVFPLFIARGLTPPSGFTPDPRISQITIGHLINHTGGLGYGPGQHELYNIMGITPGTSTAWDNLRWIYAQPLLFTPGTSNAYSNESYDVLRMLAAAVTGQTIDTVCNTTLMGRYGVDDFYAPKERLADRSPREPWYRTWEIPWDRWISADNKLLIGASAEQYLRFLRLYHLADGWPLLNQTTGVYTPFPNNGYSIYWGVFSGTTAVAVQRRWDEVSFLAFANANVDLGPLIDSFMQTVDNLPANAWGCRGDHDGNGSASIQDIFSFLGDYFALESRANVNGLNGVTLDDLFDFLRDWFAGC